MEAELRQLTVAPIVTPDCTDGLQITYPSSSGEPKKLKLSLRTLELEVEISRQHLPKNVDQLLHLAIEQRHRYMEGKYSLVCIWIRMKSKGPFWKKFNCHSLDELLARLDLPNGRTLGILEVLVRMFNRETFLLAGDEALGYLIQVVSRYQRGIKQGLKACQDILDAYCAKYTAFDKSSFCEIVNWYANTTWILPYQKRTQEVNVYARPSTEPAESSGGKINTDHVGQVEKIPLHKAATNMHPVQVCEGCSEKDRMIKVARQHIEKLEELIRSQLGSDFVPKRPSVLEGSS